ncbi:uncharacterized protein PFL1_05512 [Pseudozyma flocculosa PF-1]|uniref:Uncharacterized protein n=2 Tax=Pseudozyma flocculosa TaxID=84751 RepID=A0A5C3FC73_9BASI|nr:uncharacterized protein PFL1_05512 [Pseudozyma flocculosa PF-1]EPQ26877.1 hypothetical protein PFL1_05512 [Pseudozyma flocculosa PF-1]SPO41217.1 uncharacterized protein PSFLO_06699 [Pseudozyma flocculosa]
MSKLLRNGIPRKENGKIDFTPKAHHGFTTFIWILGFILPPIAVLVRFGVGKDLAINIPLTVAGWIPGQIHNWFIQNIRNNDNAARTPKWARRYGLVDETGYKRKEKKRAWVGKYRDRDGERRVAWDEEQGRIVELPPLDERGEPVRGTPSQPVLQEEFYNPDLPTPSHAETYGDVDAQDGYGSTASRKKRLIPRLGSKRSQATSLHADAAAADEGYASRTTPLDGDELDRELTGGAPVFSHATPHSASPSNRARSTSGSRQRRDSSDSDFDGPEDPERSLFAPPRSEAARLDAYDASRQRQHAAGFDDDDGFVEQQRRRRETSSGAATTTTSARQPDVMDLDHQF